MCVDDHSVIIYLKIKILINRNVLFPTVSEEVVLKGILLYTSGLYNSLEALGVNDHKPEVLYD